VGDETLWLSQTLGLPVAVGPNRSHTIAFLISSCQAQSKPLDRILLDDGLQDFSFTTDSNVVVIDAERGFGNGHCLPAGPLREPFSLKRLTQMKAIIIHGLVETPFVKTLKQQFPDKIHHLILDPLYVENLANPNQTVPVHDFVQQQQGNQLYAVAGIGHPARFFRSLATLGLSVQPHPFPDHHCYQDADFDFAQSDNKAIMLTEKDAVKCHGLAETLKSRLWVLHTQPSLSELDHLLDTLGCGTLSDR